MIRSQRIPAVADLPFGAPLLTATDLPLYQRISAQVKHLHTLGLTLNRIAEHLGITDKAVARALAWLAKG